MSPKKQLTVLVTTINAVGHVNATAGTTAPLLARGHRIIFMVEQAYKGHVAPLGFEEHVFKLEVENFSRDDVKPGEDWAKGFLDRSIFGPDSTEAKFCKLLDFVIISREAQSIMRQLNDHVRLAIEQYRPDLIVFDTSYLLPEVARSGIPWIHNMSLTPQVYSIEEGIPPTCSGYPTNSARTEAWNRFKAHHIAFYYSKQYNDCIESLGYERFVDDRILPSEQGLLTVYAYPDEINYEEIRRKPWFNLEVFNKNQLCETVDLPALVGNEFYQDSLDSSWSGKWVYLSMGSMGSIDLSLMKRILDALAETQHKYIVSKGPRHAEYSLPRNAWGDRYLPQTKLVPLMDLVITHGGNNTVTETFAQGRPMLVLPMFGDQYDNAQRLHETGFGFRLDTYSFTKEDMIRAVNELLGNVERRAKLSRASKRILSSNKHEELADLIESKLGVV